MRHIHGSSSDSVIARPQTALLLLGVVVAAALGCTVAREPDRRTANPLEAGPVPATKWRELGLRDERGRLPSDGRLKALRDRELHLARRIEKSPTLPTASEWTPQGPFTRGGRARAMVIHPEDSRILWAATGSGGVWKSEDGGKRWRPLTDHLGHSSGCLVLDPRDLDLLYWGTGEFFHAGGDGAGVFISPDGGQSWKLLEATRRWPRVPSLAISPDSTSVLMAAVTGHASKRDNGVFRSRDAGRSWTRVLSGETMTPTAVAFQPGDGSRVLAATREGFLGSLEIHVRYSNDGGDTWEVSSGLPTTTGTIEWYEIAFSPSAPQIAYAASKSGVYRSDDGGASFAQVSGRSLERAPWASMLWVSPLDPQLLLSGGITLWRSFDGGVSWRELRYMDVSRRDAGYWDTQAVVADPGYDDVSNRRVYFLNDGGIDRVDDVRSAPLTSEGVTSLDRGMQTTEYYTAVGRKRDGLLLGGTQDRGVVQGRVGGRRTQLLPSGDGFCALIDPDQGEYLYGCSQHLDIKRYGPTQAHVSYDLPDRGWDRANANAPVLLDPNEPHRMLAGGASLWRSENVRDTTGAEGDRAVWEEIKPALPSAGPGDDRGYISAVAVTPGDSEAIWVAHNDGQLHRTRNGLARKPRWDSIDDNASRNPLPNRWISRVRVDAVDRNRVFVALGGFTRGNLWRTEDGGETWQRASRGLPRSPVWSLVQHPERPDTWIAGTEVGLYVTENGGRRWASVPAPITAAAQDVSFLQGSSTLLVGTFGRGLWTVDLGGGNPH